VVDQTSTDEIQRPCHRAEAAAADHRQQQEATMSACIRIDEMTSPSSRGPKSIVRRSKFGLAHRNYVHASMPLESYNDAAA
jgi:hypothetical protein